MWRVEEIHLTYLLRITFHRRHRTERKAFMSKYSPSDAQAFYWPFTLQLYPFHSIMESSAPLCPAGWSANPTHHVSHWRPFKAFPGSGHRPIWHMWRRPQTHLWDNLSSTAVVLKDGHEDKCQTNTPTHCLSKLSYFKEIWSWQEMSSVFICGTGN